MPQSEKKKSIQEARAHIQPLSNNPTMDYLRDFGIAYKTKGNYIRTKYVGHNLHVNSPNSSMCIKFKAQDEIFYTFHFLNRIVCNVNIY